MITRLTQEYVFTQQENECITLAANDWDSGRVCINAIKDVLHDFFDLHQNKKCCYCGLTYDETGRGEIDHIAPKSNGRYPQFSFTPANLAKACQLCNSSSMKHYKNTVTALGPTYDQCTFNIVHPYLDDHTQHYAFRYGKRHVLISAVNGSLKAVNSIEMFKLASEGRTRARAKQRNQERLEARYNISAAIKGRIRAVLTFRF